MPIIGCSEARVASSRIDIEAGLSKCCSRKMPPGFCANAPWLAASARAAVRPTANVECRSKMLILAPPKRTPGVGGPPGEGVKPSQGAFCRPLPRPSAILSADLPGSLA